MIGQEGHGILVGVDGTLASDEACRYARDPRCASRSERGRRGEGVVGARDRLLHGLPPSGPLVAGGGDVSARDLMPRSILRSIVKSPNSMSMTPRSAEAGWRQS